MIKTSVKFAIATIAVCGAVALAAKSPAHDQSVSHVTASRPAADTGLPKIYPDVVDPNATRWMPVFYG